MERISYHSNFKNAIQLAKDKGFFLGSGNPNAKLLFIGKEAAIDSLNSSEQHKREICNNTQDWELNIQNNTQFSEVDNWFVTPQYNPLYPYKGQRKAVESRNENGDIIGGKRGTSRTWFNYQKITDAIYFDGILLDTINFHEYAFLTELNQITGKYSKDVPKKIRKESIEKRKELLQTPFFKDFPIIIVAVGHYVRDFDIDLQDLFKVKFDKLSSEKYSKGLSKDFINIHFDNLEQPTKLLIHTNQLSMVSNELINRLGQICNDYLRQIQ